MLEFKDSILCEAEFVGWLVEVDDALMGKDRNDVLDWDSNDDE